MVAVTEHAAHFLSLLVSRVSAYLGMPEFRRVPRGSPMRAVWRDVRRNTLIFGETPLWRGSSTGEYGLLPTYTTSLIPYHLYYTTYI